MDKYRVSPKEKVKLQKIDTEGTGEKEAAQEKFLEINEKLEALQERLYAEGKHKVLVVLQGMDTSGKDGTIRAVFDGVNPQGVRVAGFKVPTAEELAHDYLWRVHKQTPGKGEIVIFNRSHYEDVLVVRIHKLVPDEVWKKRFDQINDFERLLAEEGTTILKFFLHISRKEQKERLLERLADPSKHWKFNPGDLKERAIWDQYEEAYEDVLERTSTEWAPWYVIPADKKWFRNLVIGKILLETLEKLDIEVPPPMPAEEVKQYQQQLENE